MPKEAKKFINPLLRPSQPLEVRQDSPTELEKRPASARKNVDVATPSTVDKSPFAQPEVALTDTSPDPDTNAANGDRRPEMPDETRSTLGQFVAPPVSTSESPRESSGFAESPLLSTRPEKSIAEEKTHFPISQPLPARFVPESSVPAGVENRAPVVDPRFAYTTAPATVHPSIEEPEISTYTSTIRETLPVSSRSDFPSTKQVDISSGDGDEGEPDLPTTPLMPVTRTGRRRRGELAFEKTHERITLWIDKRLKQAFEELAYQQELPKTTLLNEAVADLLRKYDIH